MLVCLFIFASQNAISQKRICNSEQRTQELIESNPDYAKFHNKMEQLQQEGVFDANHRSAPCAAGNKIIIPIAIHYEGLNTPSAAEITCLENLALQNVQSVNDDFAGVGFNTNNWAGVSSNYPGTNLGESCLEFCLPTQGHPTTLGDYTGSYAITINRFTGDNAPGWNGYLNIYVRSINAGVLGYSPLPGMGTSNTGVTINSVYFGQVSYNCGSIGVTSSNPYNRGRTLTHEIGHNLNLRHIWGNCNSNCCGASDLVADTPDQDDDNGGCPGNLSSCGPRELHMNFMDYTNDACMYMFSAGQVTRMENLINNNNNWAPVVAKGLVVCAGSNPTGCPPSYAAANALTGSASQTGGSYNNGDYETDGDIESTQNIPAGTTIDYDSKTLICLNSGFNTSANIATTNFYAFIDGCNNGAGGGALTGDEDENGLRSIIGKQKEEKKTDTTNK